MTNRPFGSDFWRDKTGAKQDPLAMLRDGIERAVESVGNWASELRGSTPRVDLIETQEGVEIEAELPGMDQSQIELTLSGNTLLITGEKSPQQTDDNRRHAISERFHGRFSRSITLPFEPDAGGVTATFRNGVLHVRLPKPDHLKPRSQKVPITP
jgi:HSP20 family protein